MAGIIEKWHSEQRQIAKAEGVVSLEKITFKKWCDFISSCQV
jgi:hypothetical protein